MDLMAPQRVSDAATHAFGDDVSVVDLPTFGKGGKKHNRGVDVTVRGDGMKRHKFAASKKILEGQSVDAASGKEEASAPSEKAVEGAKGMSRFYHESI